MDTVAGGAGNDTVIGTLAHTGTVAGTDYVNTGTLSILDSIDGGAGANVLNLVDTTGGSILPSSATIANVQTINVRSTGAVGESTTATFDTSGLTGVTAVNVTQSFGNDYVTVGDGQAVNVTNAYVATGSGKVYVTATDSAVTVNAKGDVTVYGGSTQTVTAEAAAVTLGATTGATGAISVTETKMGANNIAVDGGTTVTVVAASTTSNGTITIGAATPATGAVSVTSNLTGDGTATLDQGNIAVTGGTSVTVNSNLTIAAKDQTAGNAHTFGDVHVVDNGKTTSVTVNQTYAETEFTKPAVAVVKETSVVTFSAMTSGQSLTFNGLTFTASQDLTAAQVAAAFSNLTAADTQSAQGPVANGVYTGTFNTAVWTSGAANGAVVTFTAKDESETSFTFTGTATAPTNVETAGTAASSAVTSANSVTYGAVRVDGNATASITSVSLNGYSTADLGVTGTDLNALTTLSLANGGAASVATSATSLNLTLNKVSGAIGLDGTAATIKTLNVTTTGSNSTSALTAAAVESLTVTGTKSLDIHTGSTLTALKTVTVTGSAGLNIDMTGLANQTSVDTTGTTGTVTAKMDASKATYTGGAGVDNVSLTSSTVDHAVSTGAGNDTVTLLAGTTSLAANISGGDGTDTLVMAAADAATASATATFATHIDGFEVLGLGAVTAGAQNVINLANLDNISHVITGASTIGKDVTITGATDNAADTVSLVVDGNTYTTAAAIYADGTAIAAALATAINGNNGLLATAAAGVLTITSTTTHVDVGTIAATSGGGAADTVSATTAYDAQGYSLTNLAAGSTVEITSHSQVVAALADATGAADSLNVVVTNVNGSGNTIADLTVANIENLNISIQDGDNTGPDTHNLVLNATGLTTVTIGTQDGTAVDSAGHQDLTGLNLTINSATPVTTVDASNLLGSLTYTANNGVTTVTGGSGADTLTASGSGDTLIGGAGNDVLKGADLTTLTGGAGNDTFMMNVPTNVNSYSSITDIAAGDKIDLDAGNAGTVVFTKAAITLADTAVFQDYANAAANALGTDGNNADWFQYGGNTYIVQSGNTTAGNDFVNGQDAIIKIVGLVDLSHASYNQSIGTLEIA